MEIYTEERNSKDMGIYGRTQSDRDFVLAIYSKNLNSNRVKEIIKIIKDKNRFEYFGRFDS